MQDFVRKIIINVDMVIKVTYRIEILYLWKLATCLVLKVKVNVSTAIHRKRSSSSNVTSSKMLGTTIAATRVSRLIGHRPIHACIAGAIIGIKIVANSLLG